MSVFGKQEMDAAMQAGPEISELSSVGYRQFLQAATEF